MRRNRRATPRKETAQGRYEAVPLFELLTPADDIVFPGILLGSEPHMVAKSGLISVYQVSGGQVLLTAWRGRLHEVIYCLPERSRKMTLERNEFLFHHYGAGIGWVQLIDDGFGIGYERRDRKSYALWNRPMDFVNFTTAPFHEFKWG